MTIVLAILLALWLAAIALGAAALVVRVFVSVVVAPILWTGATLVAIVRLMVLAGVQRG